MVISILLRLVERITHILVAFLLPSVGAPQTVNIGLCFRRVLLRNKMGVGMRPRRISGRLLLLVGEARIERRGDVGAGGGKRIRYGGTGE